MKKFWAGALLAPFAVLAEEPVLLDPVVVTATGQPVPESRTLAAVTVIGREEIERSQAADVAELLRFSAGIDIGRSGGPGQITSAFIRGGESNHTLVLIDGVRMNPATSGGGALQNIAPEMIERIEIVRGPRSTLYGSDAIAGVVNIITRSGSQPGVTAQLRAGADDTREASARLAQGDAHKRWNLFAEHGTSEGIPTCRASRLDRGYDRTTVNASGSAQAGAVEIGGRLWSSEGTTEYLDSCAPAFGLNPVAQDFRNQVAEVTLAVKPTLNWESRLSLSRMQDDIRQRQPNFLGERDHVETVRPRAHWLNTVQVGQPLRLSLGLEAAREEVDARSFGDAIDEQRDIGSAFLQAEVDGGRHRGVAALAAAHYEGFGSQLTGNVEYGFALSGSTDLIASAGTGFRAPDATDRFGFGGNPDLDPEEARNYELGLRQRFGEHQRVDLRLFRSEVDDLITVQFDPSNDPTVDFGFRAVNIDEFRNQGAELTWRWVSPAWLATLGGIAQDPEDRSTGQQLLRRARRSASAKLLRRFGPHALGVDVLASGERPDVDAASGANVTDGGYVLLNLDGTLALDEAFSLGARIENVLDKDYETAAGYRQPGASIFVSLRYAP